MFKKVQGYKKEKQYIYIYIYDRRVYQQMSVKPINFVLMDCSLLSFQMRFGVI